MKITHTLLLLLAIGWWATARPQGCTGNILSDDFSTTTTWTTVAGGSGCGGADGTMAVSGQLTFTDFVSRQTRRVRQSLGGSLPGISSFQADFDFEVGDTSTSPSIMVLALSATNDHPRSNTPGGAPATNNDMIEVYAYDNGTSLVAQGFSKNGTILGAGSAIITLAYNTTYFGRLERWNGTQASLHIYTDAARTVHATGSPVCFAIDAGIQDLDWAQLGGTAIAGCPRETDAWIDNLCIRDQVNLTNCSGCPGASLFEVYNAPTSWTQQGVATTCGAAGTLTFTAGALRFADFRPRQTLRWTQDLSNNFPGAAPFRAEFDFNFASTSEDAAAMVLALSATNAHPRSNTEGGAPATNNDAIEVFVFENAGQLVGQVVAKNGTVIGTPSTAINLNYDMNYFGRVERLSPVQVQLSIFSDQARTAHVPGSPQCLIIDADIVDLDWAQQGGLAVAGCARITDGWVDNLCVYDTPIDDPCVTCVPVPLSASTSVVSVDCALSTGSAAASASGGFSPYSYAWSNGDTTDTIVNVPFGTYTVTVTDVSGCSDTTTVTLDSITIGPSLIPPCPGQCNGSIIVNNVSGGNPPFSYEYQLNGGTWGPGNTFSSLCAGSYTVAVTELGSNCTTSVVVNLTATATNFWAKHPITNGASRARGWGNSVANHGAYLTGEFEGDITFQNDLDPLLNITLSSGVGDQEGFLAKYDECGIDWAFRFGSTSLTVDMGDVVEVHRNAADPTLILGGNINGPMPGGFQGAAGPAITTPVNAPGVNLITSLVPGVKKGFVASVNATDGSVNWFYLIGDNVSERTELTDLKVDEKGDIYVIGNFNNIVTFGLNSYTTYGNWDPIVFQLDLAGNHPASVLNHFGTLDEDRGYALDVPGLDADSRPILVATGFVNESAVNLTNLANFPASAGNGDDIFAIALQVSPGTLTDVSFIAHRSPGDDAGLDVACDPSPTVFEYYLTGYYQTSLDFVGSYPGSVPVSDDAFVSKHDVFSHNEFWVELIAHDGDDAGRSLTLMGTDVYAVGEYSGVPVNSIVPAATTAPDADVYLAELTQATGAPTNVEFQQGAGAVDRALDISNHASTLYTSGAISAPGPLDFPGQTALTPNSTVEDAYFARLDPTTLNFFKQGPLGSDLASAENDGPAEAPLLIYPNPTRSVFYVELDEVAEIRVFDLSGRVVHTLTGEQSGQTEVDLSNHPTGMYLVEVRTGSTVHRQPVIKQ